MDPLYDEIENRLATTGRRKLNPTDFESCAASLLMPIYPGLTPMPGGGDAGMDGAFGSAEGAYPLVTTTEANVLRNVRKSLRAFLARRYRGPKRAVVATSRGLTPGQKRKIEEAAGELGVKVVNIHDRPYFVERLYRETGWRLKLLGIAGHPLPLSRYPLHGRYAQPGVIVGRETDLAWLRETPGDLLLAGQPGSGKTYLHQVLAADGTCLFAVDFDRARLADAIRAINPTVVVIDDAHVRRDELEALIHTRYATGARFAIHANCWPAHVDDLRRRMGLASSATRLLDRLRPQLIVDLIRQLGIEGPNELLHPLLDRSDGKPGLAASLVDACKRDDVTRVWSGEAVAEHLLAADVVSQGSRGRIILGVLALGGDAGLSANDAADILGIPAVDVWGEMARLGAGGVVDETGAGRLQVRPPAVRPPLLLDTLLSAGSPVAISDDVIGRFPSIADATHELISARQRSPDRVDPRMLLRLTRRAGRSDVWMHLGHADLTCASLILQENPEQADVAAPGLLRWAARRALPLLLNSDAGAGLRTDLRHAVTEWLSPATHGEDSPAERRSLLLDAASSLSDRAGSDAAATVAWAVGQALGVTFHHARSAPGSANSGVLTDGLLSIADVQYVAGLWPSAVELLGRLPVRHVRPVLNAIELWCITKRITYRIPSPRLYQKPMRVSGKRMLADLGSRADTPRAIRSWAARVNDMAKLGLRIPVDEPFDALFGRYHWRGVDWEKAEIRYQSKLRRLARGLLRRPMAAVAGELASMDQEMLAFGETTGEWDRRTFYDLLATECVEPARWVEAAVAEKWSASRLAPFLERSLAVEPANAERILSNLLVHPAYAQLAARQVFGLATLSATLLDTALAVVEIPARDAEFSLVGEWPVETVARLLRHHNPVVRAKAALAEWGRVMPPSVRTKLITDWETAVVDIPANDHHLPAIFGAHPNLAFTWAEAAVKSADSGHDVHERGQGIEAACSLLTRAQRGRLLELLVGRRYDATAFDIVVGSDVALFADWIAGQPSDRQRLRPLQREWSPRWEQFLLAALNAGCTPAEVAEECTPTTWGFGLGEHEGRFRDQLAAVEKRLTHPDRRLHPAARAAAAWAAARVHEVDERRRQSLAGEL